MKLYTYCFFLLFLFSCKKEETPAPQPPSLAVNGCFVVNMGNYSDSNGSLSYFDEDTRQLTYIDFRAINGRKLAAIIESALLHDTTLLLMCNHADKVELINSSTYQAICAPIDLVTPRYAAVYDKIAYITCWGDMYDGGNVKPYIAKIDMEQHIKVGEMACNTQSDRIEAITVSGQTLFVGARSAIEVYDVTSGQLLKVLPYEAPLGGFPQKFVTGYNGMLWASVADMDDQEENTNRGLLCIDPEQLEIVQQLSIPTMNPDGEIAINKDKDKIYFLTGFATGGNQNTSAVIAFDLHTYTVGQQPIVSGKNWYGIGINPHTGYLYTADVQGFRRNSTFYLYNDAGVLQYQTSDNTGVASSRFVFRND